MKKEALASSPRRGGRPSREDAGKLEDKILDAAAALFFSEGYGLVSIEKISAVAGISKRTFYARFENKAAVFRSVVHRVIQQLYPANTQSIDHLFEGKTLGEVLSRIAPIILKASLSPSTLSLLRVVLAEAKRFPELAIIMNQQGMRQEAITRIAGLLEKETKAHKLGALNTAFAAEQFLFMLTAAPQRRALGLGIAMKAEELDAWARHTVDLFLYGCLQPSKKKDT
jgi:AcrR family transcriptional regulator